MREGALLRDDDSNILYDVKNGALTKDPYFNQETGLATTIRRIAFIVAILGLVGWLGWRIWAFRAHRTAR